jgi:hypothetical protein
MWAALVVAAVALAALAFMLMFLIALLRDGAPSVCYWAVPVRRELYRPVHGALSANCVEDDCRALECNRGEYDVELLEKENYAKAECSSGLIALDVPASDGLGWRSIRQRRGSVFRQHRL